MMCLGNERRNAREDCGANGQRGGRELPYGAVGMEMESRHLSVARIAEVFRLCWMIFAGLTNLFNLIFFSSGPGLAKIGLLGLCSPLASGRHPVHPG